MASVMAAPNMFASMNVTLYQDTGNYSFGNGGEFRAVGDAGLNGAVDWSAYSPNTAVSGAYFQTFCTEELEVLQPCHSLCCHFNWQCCQV